MSNSTIRLQVYLEDLSYEYIHESPAYSVEALVSNIGGVMGLCLGLSALTLVEFVEYLLELMVNGWRNCRNRKERAAERSGIKKIEVLPSDPKTGMQCKWWFTEKCGTEMSACGCLGLAMVSLFCCVIYDNYQIAGRIIIKVAGFVWLGFCINPSIHYQEVGVG